MTRTDLASPPQQTLPAEPSSQPAPFRQAAAFPTPAIPADVLMRLIVRLLATMFLPATGGDRQLARMAAFETVNQYNPRNHVDLIIIAQIIASSLAAVGSIGLALTDNLSLSMAIRFRTNAVALNRVAEQARRALREVRPDHREHEPPFIPDPNQAQYEEAVLSAVAAAQQRTAEAMTRFDTAEPTATPIATPSRMEAPAPTAVAAAPPPITAATNSAPTKAAPHQTPPAKTTSPAVEPQISDEQWQTMWASAMTDVAQEFTADLQNLPPAERQAAIHRAESLSSVATTLLSGNVPPRLRPGALDPHIPT